MYSRAQSRPYVRICIASAVLIIVGSAFVLSSSTSFALLRSANPAYYFEKHVAWLLLGAIGIMAIGRAGAPRIRRYNGLIFAASMVPMVLASLAKSRWLRIGPISVQPSEFVKLTFIVLLADFIARHRRDIAEPRTLAKLTGVFILIAGLLEMQKDLGTLVIILMVFGLMLFLAGLPRRYIASLAAAGAVAVVLLILPSPYRRERVVQFLHPERDPQGSGYQTIQARIALQSGGWIGRGIGGSEQKLKYLPEAHKDYVYAIVGEETGLVGTVIVLGLFAVLIFSGMETGARCAGDFDRFLVAGISGMFGFQFLLHACVVLGLVPSKGTTLPFFSVGGTAVLVCLLALGLLLEIGESVCLPVSIDRLDGTYGRS